MDTSTDDTGYPEAYAAACAAVGRARQHLLDAEKARRAVQDASPGGRAAFLGRPAPDAAQVTEVAASFPDGAPAPDMVNALAMRGFHEDQAASAVRRALDRGDVRLGRGMRLYPVA